MWLPVVSPNLGCAQLRYFAQDGGETLVFSVLGSSRYPIECNCGSYRAGIAAIGATAFVF
jgi:hypothetical protein